jgi:hypothetical protein
MSNVDNKESVRLSEAVAEHETVRRAEKDLKEGKSPSTAAGEFVREEIEHVRKGKHGAKSPKQAIAIGLSKARRAGVPLGVPKRGEVSERTRASAERETRQGPKRGRPSAKRSRATIEALKREPKSTVSKQALSTQAKRAAAKRTRRATNQKTKRASVSPRRSTRSKSTVATR